MLATESLLCHVSAQSDCNLLVLQTDLAAIGQ